ncbi:flavin reductase family protein [Sporosarcina sp. ACRSL]|uniref:flavin reductase family protein n=1 Tax=Sporosarcina sp. ACRSL TaxID=2918215 RepID=UPI001EF73501|nr:flavin reductase family protein [Sporosarcina sp. ACRSL]MCG7344011.1 flavin reductase family protein [Sporosarcina sp. ACRSL]
MIINPDDLNTKDTYKLLIGAVVPRPIAWVSTISSDGTPNLAPFSFFSVASRKPPILSISIGPGVGEREGTTKDTLVNILEQKEFVINITPATLRNEMHRSSENFPSDVNEFEYTGLTPGESEIVKSPRVEESPISMECILHDVIKLGEDHLVLGRVVRYHVNDELYEKGRINLAKLAPIGRLAGNYSLVDKIFSLPDDNSKEMLPKSVDSMREIK